jgi:hypothetical protein
VEQLLPASGSTLLGVDALGAEGVRFVKNGCRWTETATDTPGNLLVWEIEEVGEQVGEALSDRVFATLDELEYRHRRPSARRPGLSRGPHGAVAGSREVTQDVAGLIDGRIVLPRPCGGSLIRSHRASSLGGCVTLTSTWTQNMGYVRLVLVGLL